MRVSSTVKVGSRTYYFLLSEASSGGSGRNGRYRRPVTEGPGQEINRSPHSRRVVALRVLGALAVIGVAFAIQRLWLSDDDRPADLRRQGPQDRRRERPARPHAARRGRRPAPDPAGEPVAAGLPPRAQRGRAQLPRRARCSRRSSRPARPRAGRRLPLRRGELLLAQPRQRPVGGLRAQRADPEADPPLRHRAAEDRDRRHLDGRLRRLRHRPARARVASARSAAIRRRSGRTPARPPTAPSTTPPTSSATTSSRRRSSTRTRSGGPACGSTPATTIRSCRATRRSRTRSQRSGLDPVVRNGPGGHDSDYWNGNWREYLGFYARALNNCPVATRTTGSRTRPGRRAVTRRPSAPAARVTDRAGYLSASLPSIGFHRTRRRLGTTDHFRRSNRAGGADRPRRDRRSSSSAPGRCGPRTSATRPTCARSSTRSPEAAPRTAASAPSRGTPRRTRRCTR